MRIVVVGVVVVFGSLLALAQAQQINRSVYESPLSALPVLDSNLISHFAPTMSGSAHTMTVLDPSSRVLAVYHVHAVTGVTTLKSVRNLNWDLQMVQFNSDGPSPQDVRDGLNQ